MWHFKLVLAVLFFIISFLPIGVFAHEYYRDDIGLNAHWALGGFGLDDLYEQRLVESRTTWVREHFQTHSFYKESQEAWLDRYTTILQKYKNHNISVLGMIAYNEEGGKTQPDLEEWSEFVTFLVTNFKDYVKYWQIWNEPDSPTYLTPHNPETYIPILSTAYDAIKATDPEAKVVTAGLASPNKYFAKRIYEGALDKFDIFAFHAYYCQTYFANGNVDSFETKMEQLKATINSFKPGQEVWLTEIGCSQNNRQFSEKQQKDYFKYILPKIAQKDFVDKIFLYNIRDYDFRDTYENSFGLCKLDMSAKLAWKWYKNIKIGPYNQSKLSFAEEEVQAKKLKKKLEKYFGKKQIPGTLEWQKLVEAHVYGEYPVKAIVQALRFDKKTIRYSTPYAKWKKTATYKKYINKEWYNGKLIQAFTYKKARLPLAQEDIKAKELKHLLKKNYKFEKLRIDSKNWKKAMAAYIYGNYPIKAIARMGKYPQVVNAAIPYERWKNSSVYEYFVIKKVY